MASGFRRLKGSGRGGIASLELEGFEELTKKFDKLEEKVRKKALRPSLRAGAKIIQKDARRRARKLSGKNAKFIKIKSLKRSKFRVGLTIQTGTREQLGIPRKSKGYYPFSQEFGTSKRRGHPYMRPALRTKRVEATREIGKVLGKKIEQIARKKA